MSRKQTGLRNRFRSGRSQYSALGKSKSADSYGSYQNGRNVTGETIGGRQVGSMIRKIDDTR